MRAGEGFIGVILGAELGGQRLEIGNVLIGPPLVELAGLVIFCALVVEMMAEFMADHCADAAIIDRRIGIRVKEGRLKDGGGEDDLDHAEIGIGVDLHRGHAPFPAIDGLAQLADIIIEVELVRAHRITEQVARFDGQAAIVAPAIGIADLGREGGELLVGAGLGLVAHPRQAIDAATHGRQDILDQQVHRRLGFGREIFGDIDLADFLTQRFLEEGHAALPTFLALGRARQGGAEKGEIGAGDIVGQIVGIAVDATQQQAVLQHADRRLGNQRCFAGDGGGLGDQQVGGLEANGAEIGGEVETGRGLLQRGEAHLVIGLVRVAAVDLGPVDLGDLGLECHQRGGARLGIGFAQQGQHLFEMRDIGGADRRHLLALVEIIVAVGQAQATLHHREDVGFGILVVLADIEAERAAHAGARRLAGQGGIGLQILDRADLGQPGLDRGKALRLDRSRIQIGRIGDADLAVGIGLGAVQYLAGALLRQFIQHGEGAIVGLVRRDRRVLQPGAVGIFIEIVAGLDRTVHAGGVEAVSAIGRLGGRGSCGRGGGLVGMGHGRGEREAGGGSAHQEELHEGYSLASSGSDVIRSVRSGGQFNARQSGMSMSLVEIIGR